MTNTLTTPPRVGRSENGTQHHEHGPEMSDAAIPGSPRAASILRKGCTAVAFLLPVKLSLTYIALVPLLLYWGYLYRTHILSFRPPEAVRRIVAPLCVFIVMTILSSGTGISLGHSITALGSLLFFLLTVPMYASHASPHAVCFALIAGQSLAALHSLFDAALPQTLPKLFLGKVTESGQLSLTIPLTLGAILVGLHNTAGPLNGRRYSGALTLTLLGLIVLTACTLIGFRSDLQLSAISIAALALLAAGSVRIAARKAQAASALMRQQIAYTVIALPLLVCALLVNLKRGPWLGVLVGASCLLFVYARRLILPLTCGALALAVSITPIRDRLLASYEHFTIEGGRSTIWRIGAELVSEYPLGIGYHNSGILREFAPEIPSELKHFHNNLLNIAAETGWVGVLAFLWFLVVVVRTCFRDRRAPLYVAIGSAIISWQVAGLVEYNFGDSEVTLIVWVLLGLVLQREVGRGKAQEDDIAFSKSP